MIFVDRTSEPIPEILLSNRANAAREKIRTLLSTASQDHLAQLRITFDSSIWNAAKGGLFQLFHSKCAYCETPLVSELADLEHFRPKQGAEMLRGERNQHYYAWLAYE
jgi:hypothetical protein